MLNFSDTWGAGKRAEEVVRDHILRYTDASFSNVRFPSLYTQGGETEIDILTAVRDVLLVIEVKNVRSITGSVLDSFWEMEGMETGERYTALNVLTQNRIHIRALKNYWFRLRKEFPCVLSVVVTPSHCEIPEELNNAGVLPADEFMEQLMHLRSTGTGKGSLKYELTYVVNSLGSEGV